MSGATSTLPHTPSLSAQGQVYLHLTRMQKLREPICADIGIRNTALLTHLQRSIWGRWLRRPLYEGEFARDAVGRMTLHCLYWYSVQDAGSSWVIHEYTHPAGQEISSKKVKGKVMSVHAMKAYGEQKYRCTDSKPRQQKEKLSTSRPGRFNPSFLIEDLSPWSWMPSHGHCLQPVLSSPLHHILFPLSPFSYYTAICASLSLYALLSSGRVTHFITRTNHTRCTSTSRHHCLQPPLISPISSASSSQAQFSQWGHTLTSL